MDVSFMNYDSEKNLQSHSAGNYNSYINFAKYGRSYEL